jgi:hypothetical protein
MMMQTVLAASLSLSAVCAQYTGTPFAETLLPGKLEAENFDVGGQGVGYLKVGPSTQKNAARPTEAVTILDVSTPKGSEQPGTLAVAQISSKDWLRYTVDVNTAAAFVPNWRIAAYSASADQVAVSSKIVVGDAAAVSADPCSLPGAGGLMMNVSGHQTLLCLQFLRSCCAKLMCLRDATRRCIKSFLSSHICLL